MANIVQSFSAFKFLIVCAAVALLQGCPKPQAVTKEEPAIKLEKAPNSFSIAPESETTVNGHAETNTSNIVKYVWENLTGNQTRDVSQSEVLSVKGQDKGDSCTPKMDAFRFIATAGNLRTEKSFAVAMNCTGVGVQNKESDDITVEPSDVLWLTPGRQFSLVARSNLKDNSLSWAQIGLTPQPIPLGENARLDFQAPLLESPCQIKDVFISAISTSPTGEQKFKTVSIHVQNPRCALTTDDGLSSNSTTKLLVASNDSVYIGTKNGLSRYQNGRVQALNTPRADAPIRIVTALAEISGKTREEPPTILIGKAVKLPALLFTIGFGVERLSQKDNVDFWENTTVSPNKYVSAILSGSDSSNSYPQLLFTRHYQDMSGGGLLMSTDLSFTKTSSLLEKENLYASISLGQETLYGGDGGLFVVHKNNIVERFDGRQWGGKGGLMGIGSSRKVRALARDDASNLWIGLEYGTLQPGGLVQYTLDSESFRRGTWSEIIKLPQGNDVRALAVDEANRLWIATDKSLTLRKRDGSFIVFDKDDGLPSADIRDIVYDPETKNLWIATGNGIARWGMVAPF